MNQLVFIENQQVVTDSLTISDVFGKEHRNVIRDIETQIEKLNEAGEQEWGVLNFEQTQYQHPQNKQWYTKFNMTEDAFTLVAMSYVTPEAMKMKVKFIQEFKRMREFIEKQEQQAQDPVELALQTSLKNYQEIKGIKEDVTLLKDSMRIDGRQEFAIKSQGKAKVMEVLGGYNSPAYNGLSKKVFSRMWRDFKNHFVLPRSPDLPKARFDEAVKFIAMWRPDTSTAMEIDSYNNQTHLKLVQ
ncbi:ORF6C domain-containing protein [Solibacillus sp. FSL H8-0523]|uniref:ORF6C domain-containing protein n=1 Tax=Solibacillus sp. FSL H8-0523 TaxID=2954511 RepID=UPI003100C173